jgi:hypothetical protein
MLLPWLELINAEFGCDWLIEAKCCQDPATPPNGPARKPPLAATPMQPWSGPVIHRLPSTAAEADEDLAYLLTHIGEDNMIMGSDYGHQDQSKEDGMVGVMRRKKSIAPAVIEKILCDNPRRFYGL